MTRLKQTPNMVPSIRKVRHPGVRNLKFETWAQGKKLGSLFSLSLILSFKLELPA